MSNSPDWLDSRIERALVWFLRIVLFLLFSLALVRGEVQEALAVAAILVVHGVVYWAAPRIQPPALRRRAVTLLDVVLGGLVFYLTANVSGQGSIVGFCVAGIVAARLSFWSAMAVNAALWLIFTLPFLYLWLGNGEPFPPPIMGNLLVYLALTFVVSYIVSMESRQSRMARDMAHRLRQLAIVHQVGKSITSTLEMDEVLNLVMTKAVEILNAEAGSLLLLEKPGDGDKPAELVFRIVTGPVAQSLVGQRLPVDEGIVGTVVQTGQGQISNVPQDDPNWSAALDTRTGYETQSVICVPLSSRDRSIGALEVINRLDGTPFDDDDLELLSTFAAQASIALENARLFEETSRLYAQTDEALGRRLQELATIEEIDHELGASLDYERSIDLVLERSIEACDATNAVIGILSPDGQRMSVRCRHRLQPDGPLDLTIDDWSADRGIIGRVVRTGQPVLADDVSVEPDYEETVEGTRSEVAVPIRREERVIGVLNLGSDRLATFGQHDLRFLEHLADHAGIAIENARLFQQERQRVQMLSAVSEINREIRASLDLERTLTLILDRVKDLVDYYIAEICLWDEAQQVMISVAGAGDPQYSSKTGGIYHLDEGYTGWIARHQQQLLIPDTTARLDVRPKIISEETPVRSYMGLPLRTGETFVGTLELASDQTGVYTTDLIESLQIFADQAAVAIHNARLFEAQQRQAREQTLLFETAAAISSSLDLDEVLGTIARKIAAALDVTSCSISDWDPTRNVVRTLIDEDVVPIDVPDDVGKVYSLDDYPLTAEVLRSREPCMIQITDQEADPAERELLKQLDYRSLLMLPMIARDNVVGLLELYERRAVREFSDDDIRLGQTLASQAAIALENARLYERTDERLRSRLDELVALQRTTQELNATLALDSILEVVLESALQTTGATHGNVMLMDPGTGDLTLRTSRGYSDQDRAKIEHDLLHPEGDSIALQVVESGQARIVADATGESAAVCVRADTRSAMGVPIFYEGVVAGLINLRHTDVNAFKPEHLAFTQSLAEQAAIAIGNALRFEDQVKSNTALRARNEQMNSLLSVSQKLRADVPLEDALEEVAYAIQETVGFNVVLISLVEEHEVDEPMLSRVAAAGLPLDVFEEAKQVRQPLARYQRLFREEYRQELCYFFPFQKREDWGARLHMIVSMPETEDWQEGQWHQHDMLLAPLQGAGGRLLGYISVDEPRDGQRPSRRTLEALAIFANQAAIAVENSQLFEDAQRRADNLGLINRVAQTFTQVTEPSQVLDTMVRAVSELLQCEMSAVFQPDPLDGRLCAVASQGVDLDTMDELCFAIGEGVVGRVAQTGNPLLIPDTEQDSRFVEAPIPIGSMMCVPIMAGEQVIGVLTAGDSRKHTLTRADQVLLATLADQAAVALESARLFADTQQAAVRLSLLNEIGRRAAAQLDLQDMLSTTVESLHRNMGYYRVATFLVDEVARELFIAAANDEFWSIIPHNFRQKVGRGLVGLTASEGKTILVNDASPDGPAFGVDDWAAPASLSVPIRIADQVVGVLHAEADRRGAFTEEDAAALEIASDQLAVAIQNAQLFKAIQRQAEHLDALRQVSQDLIALRDLDTLLHQIVDRALQLLGGEAGGIYLYRSGRQVLEWAVAIGEDVAPIGTTLLRGEGLSGQVWETGEPQMVDRYQDWEGRADHWLDLDAAVIAVPIQWGDEFLGVLNIWASSDRGPFTRQDAELLTQFSVQAAIAIQNAHLFQETRRRVAELATVNQIGQAISSALDVKQLSELIYDQVSNLLDSRNFFVALFDSERELICIEFLVEHGQPQPPVHLKLGQGLTSYLLTTGHPLLLLHGTEEFLREHNLTLESTVAKSWLGVPMIAEDRVIGAIAVQHYEREEAFDEGHLELMTTIAGQAAVAFQNASLFEEREQRIEELAVLNEMAQAIGSTLEMDALLELVYNQSSRLIDTTNFYIALYDEKKHEIAFPFTVDPEKREDWSPRKGGTGLTGQIIESREPFLLPTGAAGMYREAGREVHTGLCRSWLGVPMIAEDKVLGVIAVQSYDREYVYDEHDLQLLSTVAAQVAVSVRNAQLYQQIVGFSTGLEEMVEARTHELAQATRELTTQRDRAETLYRITSELSTTLDLERVLHRALHLFADTLDVEHGTVMLVDQDSGYLILKATLDEGERLPRDGLHTSLKRGIGLAGWVLENRQPALVDDISVDERWLDMPEIQVDVRSLVIAPLSLGGGDILGVLTLGHRDVGHFNQEHLQLVTAAASQLAVAVSNSDLYAFITDQADQLGATLQAMQAEASKSRSILESIADGVLVLDHKGLVLLVNPAAEELLGISAMVLEEDHFRHMLGMGETPMDRDLAQGLYTELRRSLEAIDRDASPMEPRAVRLESGSRVLAVNIAPLITTIGETPGLVAALRDVSREAEVDRLKNEFISTVSHELRTPMTSIKGYTDLLFLGMAGGLTDAQRNFLQIIKSNADRLTALVNDILDISRIETGRLRLTIEPLDLGTIISETVTSFQEQYREKGLDLEWQEPEELPQVRGDSDRVTQVLANLIANAWQYTTSGGSVKVSVQEVDSFLKVDVADSGIGIAPDDLARVFDRFYRADHPVVQEAEGTGLGLSIVKMFVEMLGGDIWVESEMGVGSTFSFTLPLMTAELPEEEIIQSELIAAEASAVAKRRPKILVVESNRGLALSLRRQLEVEGYQVLLAGSGEDALWLAQEEQPQLITLDIMLPDLDGFVVLERLRAHPATAPIPVIIISILSETEKGYALGAVDYVVKPFEEDKLLRSVRLALSAREGVQDHDILVVDDDPDILALLDHALSYHGYQVRTARDGHEALAHIKESLPDLILLDLKMPRMDGYEVIRRLKREKSTRSVPIVVITASPVDKEKDKVQVLGMGASQYITKPLSIETLVSEIRSVIEERHPE